MKDIIKENLGDFYINYCSVSRKILLFQIFLQCVLTIMLRLHYNIICDSKLHQAVTEKDWARNS